MSANNRKFNFEDVKLFERAATVVSFLHEDMVDFAAFDSTFGQTTIDNLQLAITAAEATKPDKVIKSEQAGFTNIVKQKMKACREGYNTVAYFVRKVFVDNEAVLKQFGLDDYKKIRSNHTKMIMFIRSLAGTTASYREELENGGMNENVVDSLPALHQELFDARNIRDMFKKQRGKLTRERVEKVNFLCDQLVSINKTARIIYADNPAKLRKYRLPRPRGRGTRNRN